METPPNLTTRQQALLKRVKVNAPALMLEAGLIDLFLSWEINPEVGITGQTLDEWTRADWTRLARRLLEAGLRPSVHGPFFDLSPGAQDGKVLEISRQRYARALETAALFEPEHVVFHPAYQHKLFQYYQEKWIEVSLESWRGAARLAKDLGLNMVLENTFEDNPDQMAPLLTTLAEEGVGFCLDVGHASAFGQVGFIPWLEAFSPYLRALHLHDNHGHNDEHLPVGQGAIDFPGFFSWLRNNNIEPAVVTLEPHHKEDLLPSLKKLADLWPWPLGGVEP